MTSKLVSAQEAIALVHDDDVVIVSGFGTVGVPDDLLSSLAARHEAGHGPSGLTLLWGGGPGDAKDRGVNRLARPGLVKRAIGGHWGMVPRMAEMALREEFEAYNFPLGVISRMYRDMAAGLPGHLSKVGLGTFVDPRQQGCKINARSTEDLVELVTLGGEEQLYFRFPKPDVAFIRASYADADGNLSMEREALPQDVLPIATAVKNAGGIVIAQVETVCETGSIPPRQVQVPGILVDCVVVAPPALHPQTFGTAYSPALAGAIRVPLQVRQGAELDVRKVIARRAAFELLPNAVVNLGIGMPEGVATVAAEEKLLQYLTLTAESGVIGGQPLSAQDFGTSLNAVAHLDTNAQFDLYDGGGLDLAVLGLAECDPQGNVNVSRFGPKLAGAGGFINITQNSRAVVFAGTFTASGGEVVVADGGLRIVREGRVRKFVERLEQITFSGPYAARQGRKVLYVTERCVMRLTPEGLEITEIAPGIDLERDILAHMAFRPIVRAPRPMDPRLFRPEPMGLKEDLLSIRLDDRISWLPERNQLLLNFQGLKLASAEDAQAIQAAVEAQCLAIGHPVVAVVNYDGFEIFEPALDAYARVVEHMTRHHYASVTRYSTSAFLRAKLGQAIRARGLAPHIFETPQEATAALGKAMP